MCLPTVEARSGRLFPVSTSEIVPPLSAGTSLSDIGQASKEGNIHLACPSGAEE